MEYKKEIPLEDIIKHVKQCPYTAEEIAKKVPCESQTVRKKLLIEIQNEGTEIRAKKIGSKWIFWRTCNAPQ